MPQTGRNRLGEWWHPRSTPRAACAQHVLPSSWFTGLKSTKFDDNIASFPFFQKFDRTLSCEGIAFRSQPGRNVRALNRLLQNGPQLFKIPELTRASGYSGPLPVLHRPEAHTEGISQLRLGHATLFTHLPGSITRTHHPISSPGQSP